MKTFYRSKEHTILSGVFGGLGEYFNLDPLFLRLPFALSLVFLEGSGKILIPTYLVLWFITNYAPGTEVELNNADHVTESKEN